MVSRRTGRPAPIPAAGSARREKLGLRVVVVERPGSGLSDPHAYAAMADWAADMAHVADALGAERLGVVGLSGGGPYALACGAVPPLANRVAAVAVLGGVVPSIGPEATEGVIDDLARLFEPMLSELRRPLAVLSSGLLAPLIPMSHYVLRAYSSIQPEGDQRVFADPEMEAVFVDDILLVVKCPLPGHGQRCSPSGRDWGFRLADVKVPVRWWHGDADPLVPLAAAQAAVSHLPNAELILRPGESHLGGFAKADEVLEFLRPLL